MTVWSVSLSPSMLLWAARLDAPSAPSRHRAHLPRLRACAGVYDLVLGPLLLALHHGQRGHRPAKRQFVESITRAISLHLLDQHCAPMAGLSCQLGDDDLARLDAFLDSQFSDRCSVDDAANALGMNALRFARLLKSRTGESFPRYRIRRRLERSFLLLQSGQMGVTEAAMETCFASLAHFSRVFHRHFGAPPSALKR
jgi:AraC family transcriptional regulator